MLTVALIGRPNVGKSTLFNRLVRKQLAIIHDLPGVTRDYREARLAAEHVKALIVDTAGYEDPQEETLAARMWQQSSAALAIAHVAVLVVDAASGVTPLDKDVSRLLRKSGKPVLLVANKCDSGRVPPHFNEAYQLDCGDPLPVSALHGDGVAELIEWIDDQSKKIKPDDDDDVGDEKSLHLAIVGRPNAGKSTLLNALIGQQRQLTGPEPGLTRDAIHVSWEWDGQPIRLVDTAGMRRKGRIKDALEKMSVGESLRAIRLAHVVLLVVDATVALEDQDLEIARHVVDEGRCLIVVVNKSDQLRQPEKHLRDLRDILGQSLAQLPDVPMVAISALHAKGLNKIMPAVLGAYAKWNKRVGTGPLNKWLEEAQGQHSAPLVQGRRLKIRYMTQIKSRPPTFLLWANMAKSMPDDYLRYLTNHMREFFDLAGIPIRWQLKQGENPYQKKAMKKRKPLDKYREKRKQRANAKPVRGSRGKTR